MLRRTRAAVTLQKTLRMVLARRSYLRMHRAVITIQAFARGMFARRLYQQVGAWQGNGCPDPTSGGVCVCACAAGGATAPSLPSQMVWHQKAVVIQAAVRGWLARTHYTRLRRTVIYLQCCYRRVQARRELRLLRIEARSVEHYKQLHKGMEIKVIQLQCRLDEQVGAGFQPFVGPRVRGQLLFADHFLSVPVQLKPCLPLSSVLSWPWGWELTLPDTYPQAGVVHLGFSPGFSMLPIDVGLVALGMGCAPSWVLGWVQPCSTASCAGNCSGIPRSPITFLPAASAVAIWVSVFASAVTALFLGCLWSGREGSWGVILVLVVGGSRAGEYCCRGWPGGGWAIKPWQSLCMAPCGMACHGELLS